MAELSIGKKGYLLQVDDADLPVIDAHSWHVHEDDTNVYACRRFVDPETKKKKSISSPTTVGRD